MVLNGCAPLLRQKRQGLLYKVRLAPQRRYSEVSMRFWTRLLLLFVCFVVGTSEALALDTDFKICGGDVLQITVWKEDGMDREVLVLPDGKLTFPLVGTLSALGLTPGQLQNAIRERLKDKIPDASVTVMVKSPLGHTVNVLGQVAKPGELLIARKMTVMQALSQAGGLTPYASESGILVIRHEGPEKKSIEIPYKDLAHGEQLEGDIDLRPGDVVFVPTAGLL
jgi:polysaccharide export outer membrane protein